MEEHEVRYENIMCDDADFVFVAFGTSARICQKAIELARAEGIKVGLLRPITLFPFPKKIIGDLTCHVKGFLSVEMSAGQMIEDIKLSVMDAGCNVPVEYFWEDGGYHPFTQ